MRALRRIFLVGAVVTVLVGPAVPAQAESCKEHEHNGVDRVYCTLVGGCIASGPVAVDPVMCD